MSTDAVMADSIPELSTPPIQTPQQQQYTAAGKPIAPWNTPKFREEYENIRARLQHGDFSCSALPDPLAPRLAMAAHSRWDAETEQRLKDIVRAVKESTKSA